MSSSDAWTVRMISTDGLLERVYTVATDCDRLRLAFQVRQEALNDAGTCPSHWQVSFQESKSLDSLEEDIQSHRTSHQGEERESDTAIADGLLDFLTILKNSLAEDFLTIPGQEEKLAAVCRDHLDLLKECTGLHIDWIVGTAELEASQSGLSTNSFDLDARINYQEVWNTIARELHQSQATTLGDHSTGQLTPSLYGALTLLKWKVGRLQRDRDEATQDEETDRGEGTDQGEEMDRGGETDRGEGTDQGETRDQDQDESLSRVAGQLITLIDSIPCLRSSTPDIRAQVLAGIRNLIDDMVSLKPADDPDESDEEGDVQSSSGSSTVCAEEICAMSDVE